jgi:phosphoribosylanthranilate isomerase
MTWIKICGITNLEDARCAVDAGADALGFVFYEQSLRNVTPAIAREIVSKLPNRVEKVGVFANQYEDTICDLADGVVLSAVQLHGDNEDPRVADLLVKRCPDLKVFARVSMQHATPDGWAMMWNPNVVHAFLVDSSNSSQLGGTGKIFDWQNSRSKIEVIARLGRVVVAGGLTPENVAQSMRILKPWGVDVSSGVETRPGKKDPGKIKAFVAAVREADKVH